MQSKKISLAVLFYGLSTFTLTAGMAPAFAQSPAAPMPQGAPQAASVTPPSGSEVTLRYRDPSTPLTIGEMSALQSKKLEADFYKKLGLTAEAPAPVVTPQALQAKAEAHAAKPMGSVTALSIYGPTKAPQADVSINGVLVTVKGGERLAGGMYIAAVTPKSVQVVLPGKGKRGAPLTYSVIVGDVLEFPL